MFTNKCVFDLVNSLGLPETVKHLVDSPINTNDAKPCSVKAKISLAKKKHAKLTKSASRGSPAAKDALERFHAEVFQLPLQDDSKRRRF